jgi:glycosyltransferase involved in cell wall biosynthesis
LPQDEPWLLAVGMMRHGDKLASYRRLGEVLVRIMDRPWRLLVVGDGRARSEVEEALRPLGARVAWLGEQPPEAMPDIHAAADLFTWPAINEAYGLALLEAHAAGVPVVAGDFGGVSEIVRNERTGILVAAGEVERLAAAVATLLDDPERRRAMGRAAWTKVSHEHDVAAAGAALDRVLAAALRGVP